MISPREVVAKRLKIQLEQGRPIIVAGAGVGLVAKCAEIGGVDLIVSYETGRWRYRGLPQNAMQTRNANRESWEVAMEAMDVVKDVPVILGVNATDPLLWWNQRNMRKLLQRALDHGISGVENWPTVCLSVDRCPKCGEPIPYPRGRWEDDGCGFDREVEMIKLAGEMGLYTVAYAHTIEEAKLMADAGVDMLTPHVGWTAGGLRGSKHPVAMEEAVKRVEEMGQAAKSIRPDIIIICHGGPLNSPEATRYVYEHAPVVQGFEACSALERIPVENILIETAKAYKSIPLPKRNQ